MGLEYGQVRTDLSNERTLRKAKVREVERAEKDTRIGRPPVYSDDDKSTVRNLALEGRSQRKIAEITGFPSSSVAKILKPKTENTDEVQTPEKEVDPSTHPINLEPLDAWERETVALIEHVYGKIDGLYETINALDAAAEIRRELKSEAGI